MQQCDISTWVRQESEVTTKSFREAIHIVLHAIGKSSKLNTKMLMKGGILLAIRYESSRFTRDVDFSTSSTYAEFNKDAFLEELSQQLINAAETLEYGLDCKIQSSQVKPPDEKSQFQTLKLTIGYAYKSEARPHQRLMAGQCPTIVEMDYSFNEPAPKPEFLSIGDGATICAYTYADLIAEKLRALLQQPVRNRFRRQDIYDLALLLEKFPTEEIEEKLRVLQSLRVSAQSRALPIDQTSLRNPAVKEMAKRDYQLLSAEIDGALPDFDAAYQLVTKFYETLPWDEPNMVIPSSKHRV
jgi:predicted nucleotidyltransferase component of viral defense system